MVWEHQVVHGIIIKLDNLIAQVNITLNSSTLHCRVYALSTICLRIVFGLGGKVISLVTISIYGITMKHCSCHRTVSSHIWTWIYTIVMFTDSSPELLLMLLLLLLKMEASEFAWNIVCWRFVFSLSGWKVTRSEDTINIYGSTKEF